MFQIYKFTKVIQAKLRIYTSDVILLKVKLKFCFGIIAGQEKNSKRIVV